MRLKSKRRYWDLLGYHIFSLSDSNRPYDPGWIPLTRHDVSGIVACWRLETIGPFQSGLFGTLHLHGRHYPLPLLLACFRTYASSSLLPAYLQGSIPGLWLAVTGAGFTPARICDIAQPQPRPDPGFSGVVHRHGGRPREACVATLPLHPLDYRRLRDREQLLEDVGIAGGSAGVVVPDCSRGGQKCTIHYQLWLPAYS